MGIVVAPLHALASKQTAHLNSDGVTQPNCKDMPTIGYSAKTIRVTDSDSPSHTSSDT